MLKQIVFVSAVFMAQMMHMSSAFSSAALPCSMAGRSGSPLAISMVSNSEVQVSRRSLLRGGVMAGGILGNMLPALAEETTAAEPEMQTTASGVKYQVLKTTTAPGDKVGIVETAKNGDLVITTILAKTKAGKVVMDTGATRQGFAITLGQGKVIQGLEDGIIGMKAGEQRRLLIPAGPLTEPLKEDLEVEVTYERKSNLMKIFGFGG